MVVVVKASATKDKLDKLFTKFTDAWLATTKVSLKGRTNTNRIAVSAIDASLDNVFDVANVWTSVKAATSDFVAVKLKNAESDKDNVLFSGFVTFTVVVSTAEDVSVVILFICFVTTSDDEAESSNSLKIKKCPKVIAATAFWRDTKATEVNTDTLASAF